MDVGESPERIGPYRLVELLGAGAMGAVWLARDEEEDRDVALKLFPPALVARDGFFERFRREALAGSRVEHPNVVRTLGPELHLAGGDARCFLVMEHVEGRTLRDLLDELGQVPEALVREIGRQVASGLVAVHAAGLVHRDLKPENVMITPDHTARIMDLGVAKVLDESAALTREGQFAGSLVYAAPEQIRGAGVGPATDLYALGVLLHELVGGRNPFERDSAAAVVEAHLSTDAPDLLDLAPDASPFLAEVTRTLLAKDPARRFGSAAEVHATLTDGERSAWWHAHEDEALRRRAGIPRVPVRRETALHGRADDVALLRSAWEKARGGTGGGVLVLGEAGIGKSRVVDAFLSDMRSADAHVLYGSHPPFGGNAIADALVAKLGHDGLDTKLRDLLAESPLLAPPLAAWLRHEPPPEGAVSLAGDALAAALVRVMRALAAARPVVWVLEDLHFADADARKLVLSLARAVEGHRILVVVTSRPELPEAELAAFDATGTVARTSLARLGAREVVLLLRDAFRSERLAEKLGAKIALASDGNPFFVFEMIRGLRQGQFITQLPDGTWVETKVIDAIPVPPAVRDLVEARLADLPQEKREVLDLGAVQGYEFDSDLIAAVLGRKRIDVLQDLAQIERRSGVVRAAGRLHRFDHHQIQEVVYGALSVPLREECHGAIAEAIEQTVGARKPSDVDGATCADLAEHLLRAGRGTRALPYLQPALAHLDSQHRHERAARLAADALAVPGLLGGRDRCEMLVARTRRLEALGRTDEERSDLDSAVALADVVGDPALRSRARTTLGGHLRRTAQYPTAESVLEEAMRLAQESRDVVCEAAATLNLAHCLHSSSRFDAARDQCERSLALYVAAGDRRGEAAALGALGNALYRLGWFDDARRRYEESISVARAIGDLHNEAAASGNLGNVLVETDRRDEARVCIERQLRLSQELGSRPGECNATNNLGNLFSRLGRYDQAIGCFERCLALSREIRNRRGEAIALTNLGVCWSCLGDASRARPMLDSSLVVSGDVGAKWLEGISLLSLATVLGMEGDHRRAVRTSEEALAALQAVGASMGALDALIVRGECLFRAGDLDRAREPLAAAVSLARQHGWKRQEVRALALLACIPGGDVYAAEAAWAAWAASGDDDSWIRYLLWKATGERAHLVEASRLFELGLLEVPAEYRAKMRANVEMYRDITEAARAAGLGADGEIGGPRP